MHVLVPVFVGAKARAPSLRNPSELIYAGVRKRDVPVITERLAGYVGSGAGFG